MSIENSSIAAPEYGIAVSEYDSDTNTGQRAIRIIEPARLVSCKEHVLPGQLLVTELFFEVPKDYENPDAGSLVLFGRSVTKFEYPITPLTHVDLYNAGQKPWFVYLEGGPGFGNREPQDVPLTRFVLTRGYQMLYLDYRGTGLSTPVSADTLELQGSPHDQADYLKLFRQDNIVRDCEAVRRCLTAEYPLEKQPWTIFGQSFGGFVALTYLSKHPSGLREVFLTGGLAPVGKTPDEVYQATFQKVLDRNRAYYSKYPEDRRTVQAVAQYIDERGPVDLPGGGRLTVRRLLGVGLSLGVHGGLDSVHSLILRMYTDLAQFGFLTRATLISFEQFVPFDTNVIYAILHEAIYCYKKGVASNWAAERVGKGISEFNWLAGESSSVNPLPADVPLYFSGEMVFPFHFESYPELERLKEVADILAAYDEWDDLYDEWQLRRNAVPVYAASYIDDMYVDFALARETASIVHGIKVFETNSLYHNAVRARPDEVIGQLFRMRDDVID